MINLKPGTLIVLNGGSSAGKTTLAEAFQDIATEPWLLIGIDAFYRSLPPPQRKGSSRRRSTVLHRPNHY